MSEQPPATAAESKKSRRQVHGLAAFQKIAALQRIKDEFGTDYHNGLAVYVALTVCAAFARAATFEKEIAAIASWAGLRYRKTWQVLHGLETISVISIRANRGKGRTGGRACTFTLLSVAKNKQPASAPHAEASASDDSSQMQTECCKAQASHTERLPSCLPAAATLADASSANAMLEAGVAEPIGVAAKKENEEGERKTKTENEPNKKFDPSKHVGGDW